MYIQWSFDDICVHVSLNSEIWQGFLANRHSESENNADKGANNTVAKKKLLKFLDVCN